MTKSTRILLLIFFILLTLSIGVSALIFSEKNPTSQVKDTLCPDCNILLITMTNLRFDHMSGNGYFRPTTPNLDKLLKESLVFDNAFSVASWTLPDTMSIYTSLYPPEHGVMNRYDGSTLGAKTTTLIDVLKKAGWGTAALTGGFDYNQKFGLTSRVHFYDECAKGELPSYPRQKELRGGGPARYGEFGCTVPLALDRLRKSSEGRFFVHVQGFDAHCPFSQAGGKMYDRDYKGTIDYSDCLWTFDRAEPVVREGKTYYKVSSSKAIDGFVLLSERDIKHLVALYDESITLADQELGKLVMELKNLGLWDNTIVIFASEHGDMFGKHGRFMRGGPIRGTFYDDVLHVPLLIRHPKIAPSKIEGLVSHVDLMPTILDFLGLSSPTPMSGNSLLPLINKGQEVNEYIFAGSRFDAGADNPWFGKGTKIFSIRDKKWKLISETVFEENGTSSELIELYDIEQDKEELQNLAKAKPDIVSQLKSKLPGWAKK